MAMTMEALTNFFEDGFDEHKDDKAMVFIKTASDFIERKLIVKPQQPKIAGNEPTGPR